MDVAGWLRSLGLGQYEEKFRDNKIDADVLPHLTADDLTGLGVITIGDRRRLLAAIAALSGATPSADAPASVANSTSPKAPQTSAERRPHTALGVVLLRLRIAEEGHEPGFFRTWPPILVTAAEASLR